MHAGNSDVLLQHSFPDLNPNPVIETDLEGKVTYHNAAARAAFGDAEACPWLRDAAEQYALGKRDDTSIIIQANSSQWFQFTVFFVEEQQSIRFYGMDITQLKQAEKDIKEINQSLESQVQSRTHELQKSARLYRMLSECNQALVAAENEEELMRHICRIIVNKGYRMAWVGYAESNEEKIVRPVASEGFEDGYFEKAGIVWADVERGRGPTGVAIRDNHIVIGEDFLTDANLAPWRDNAIQRGYRSSIAIPLKHKGKPPFGALTIYSITPKAFDEGEIALLKELSEDLSFGIQALHVRSERNDALKSLEHSNRQLLKLSSELTLAEQKERRHVAGILHDDLQQQLVGTRIRLECVEDKSVGPCLDLIENCLRIARSLTSELCPSVLYKGNMIAVLDWLAKWAKERYDLNIQLATDLHELKLPEDLTIIIYRSVQELLFNIFKHANTRNGRIEVNSSDEQAQINVSDEGDGFDPSAAQLHSVDGGFGLFAVRERLVNLGCGFSMQSSPGKGTAFAISVNLKQERDAQASATRAILSRTRVLVVDDQLLMRQALSAVLGLSGDIEVVGEAENGRVALDRARRLCPDVVLMDLEMPEIDGIKATRLLRLEHPQIKVIGLSAHDEGDAEEAFKSAGASTFLMKNAPSDELVQAIRAVRAL